MCFNLEILIQKYGYFYGPSHGPKNFHGLYFHGYFYGPKNNMGARTYTVQKIVILRSNEME